MWKCCHRWDGTLSTRVFLDYDHKTISDESADTIVPHIINALDFASTYLLNKQKRT